MMESKLISKMTKLWCWIIDNYVYYVPVILCFIFVMVAKAYVLKCLDLINRTCINELNIGWSAAVLIIGSVFLSFRLAWGFRKNNEYISHQYACWALCYLLLYVYFRFIDNHYIFWGFDINNTHWAYSDITLIPIVVLLACKELRNESTEEGSLQKRNILGDDAIGQENDDLFGYNEMGEYLLSDLDSIDLSNHSYSVGVTGEWGTGKSSFLNLFEKKVQSETDGIVVRFYPRCVSSISYIQDSFFDTFSNVLNKYHLGIGKSISKYVKALRLIDDKGVINRITNALQCFKTDKIKESINKELEAINKRVYVIIEDLDRLTGAELLEVFKLIDRNGDFCNVIYLSAYDKKYVNSVLRKELGYDNEQDFTDKYFCYELPLPKQKTWLIKNYISHHLQNLGREFDDGSSTYNIELAREWKRNADTLVKMLGTMRHVKRYINLFMSRYPIVKDDVNVGDFLLLTLIRYKNIGVYNAIVSCDLVTRGGFLYGSKTTMYLRENYNDSLESLKADKEIVGVVEQLFPKLKDEQYGEGEYKRIRRAEFFDQYFYDQYSYRLYFKDIIPIFQVTEDDKALDKLAELMKNSDNWPTIEEYLRYRDIEWITTKEQLSRYIKLVILAYHLTNRSINYYATLGRLLYNHTADEFAKNINGLIKEEYADILYESFCRLIKRCCLSIGLFINGVLDEFQRNADKPEECVFNNKQYIELAEQCLHYYTENKTNDWLPMGTLELSLILPIDNNKVLPSAQEFFRKQLDKSPKEYANAILYVNVVNNDNGKKLVIRFNEPNKWKMAIGNWNSFFPTWIKKLGKDGADLLTKVNEENEKGNSFFVKALKDHYENDDYKGMLRAIKQQNEGRMPLNNEIDRNIMKIIEEKGSVQFRGLQDLLNYNAKTIKSHLKDLCEAGLIERVGGIRNAVYRKHNF